MKFKKVLVAILLGVTILSVGCSTAKNMPKETIQSNVEDEGDLVENLEEKKSENIENIDNFDGFTLNFIQQPEELIIFHKENLENFNALNQKYYRILQDYGVKSNDDIPEEAKEIASQMKAEFNSRKRVDDVSLIKNIYDKIITLKAEKVDTHVATDFYNDILFGFDFVDNKNLGKEGNSAEDYIRYLAVMKGNRVFVPIVEDHGDHDHIYYATAIITDELFNMLEDIVSE